MSGEPPKENQGESEYIRLRRNLLNIGIFAAEILLLVFAGPALVRFFLPVIIGWLIAQLANPLVHFLEKHLHIVRKHSSFGVIFGAIFLIVAACYYAALWIWKEAGELIQRLPVYYQALVQGLDKIAENLQSVADRMPLETREKIADFTDYLGRIVSSLGGGTVEAAGNAAKNIPSLLISFIFSLLFAYFFIAQRERVHRILRHVIPEQTKEGLRMVWGNLKYAVGGYFRAQFKIMGVVGIILAAGFLFMQIDYAVLLAALIALMDFLPMLGTGTALLPWALFCALSDALPRAAGLLVLYVVTQLTRQLIQPKMVGDSIGVDTLTTLFLLFVGYRVSGLLGMILAVPAGLIVLQLYEAGAFEHMMKNVRELMELIADWRESGDRE
ncbi:MAG: sporulation integral membrane protein YtvI [Lachnospiraceae bacterium]|nr:sporulation integral membrane protein YtvI [Lachnospiraceae bacterium]